jgi:hypothetical protein
MAVDPAEAERARLRQAVQEQVFGHRQGRQQIQFLHHHAHAERLGFAAARRRIRLAAQAHRAGGRVDEPAENFRQRTLACAVLAGQRQYFTGAQRQ